MSSDESSDSYGGRRRRTAAKRGRKGKRGTYRDDYGDSHGGPAKVKLKVKTGGTNITGKRGVKGGYTITNVSGKDANVPPQWQGFADRELDSDTEEPLVFEEAFILRMPVPTNEDQVKELERFSDMVKKREPMDEKDVWFKFLDSRRAVFNLGKTMYNAKLVDLPCLIESQKTHDNKHVFKTADISQMLLVEYPIASEQAAVSSDKPFNIDDYIYPHGLSPPLRNVRRRRFKPRINKQAIEIVERQVERLIEQDEDADEVKYEMVDESEIQEGEQLRTQAEYMAEFAGVDMSLDPALMAGASTSTAAASEPAGLDIPPATITEIEGEGETPVAGPSDIQTPAAGTDVDGEGDGDETGDGEDDEEDEEEEDEEEDSDAEGYDSDLAAMIEGEIGDTSGKAGATTSSAQAGPSAGANGTQQQKQADKSDESEGSDESDEDDLFGKGRSDDEDDNVVLGDATVQDNDETLEAKRRIRLMADEMKDLENAVSRKKGEVSRAPNPIIKRRFEDSLKKLTQELEMKKAQHVAAQNKLQHFQNEIKKADAAEKEAAAGPLPPTAEETAAAAASASGNSKADPATVFGDKKKAADKTNVGTRAREESEDVMQLDRQSPPPLPPPVPQLTQSTDISTQDIDISVIQEEPVPQRDDGNDDIQVSMQDISVGDTSGNLDDLFGDDPDE